MAGSGTAAANEKRSSETAFSDDLLMVVSNQNIYAASPISTSSHPNAKIRNAV